MSDGAAWLPPDQIVTTGWPVVGERAPAADAPDTWPLIVDGAVTQALTIPPAEWRSFDATLRMDVHCVTRWSRQGMRFHGRPLATLLDAAGPTADARFVRFEAWSDRGHDTTLPLALARAQTWIVHGANDAPLTREHGGPLRSVTPGRYFYKSVKWLRRIELLADDPLGYWERVDGYHNGADPWPGDQRYITGNLTDADLTRFRAARRYRRWQGKTIRRAPLLGWAPITRELGPLSLKGCDLRGAQLAGCDLEGANLSLSDLSGADLRGANLRGADLEGARFIDADLRDADLRDTFLTATAFFDATGSARVDGARFAGAQGMLESLAAWISASGAD